MSETNTEYGNINIKLNELIANKGISKNKLSHRAEMQRSQINHYYHNTITRLDTDVLARLCTVLECNISDLLEFIPPDNEQKIFYRRPKAQKNELSSFQTRL